MLAGCVAATDSSGEPSGASTDPLVILPVYMRPITAETSKPVFNGAVCVATVPVPPALFPHCTQGVQFKNDPAWGAGYAWACPTSTVVPYRKLGAAPGMPGPPSSNYVIDETVSTTWPDTSTCWGNPNPGWEIVFEEFGSDIGNGSCVGGHCSGNSGVYGTAH